MEVSMIGDVVAVAEAATRGLGFARSVLCLNSSAASNCVSVSHQSCSSPEAFSASGIFAICAGFLPVDAVSPPTVKFNSIRAPRRVLARRARRTRRKPLAGDSEDGEEFGGFFGDGDDGPFGGGGGGKGWNHDRDGGADGGEESSWRDPAFDFVYEVLCWIALSNCVHFAYKKFVRNVAGGIGHPSREKVPVPLVY
ncbi:hypothetical protein H6P81_003998 [Aristolochia fimbriata]|uniref:Uncharacterized protein n=1 Tax=Aristolochia fimbriata TaxID=158543 RepID=A0AAV7FGV8_ARIFI|nr:hypothetical protein H6P81_003998 [Aristolochia fimbriata]